MKQVGWILPQLRRNFPHAFLYLAHDAREQREEVIENIMEEFTLHPSRCGLDKVAVAEVRVPSVGTQWKFPKVSLFSIGLPIAHWIQWSQGVPFAQYS